LGGALGGLAQQVLQLGEELLDGIEAGAIGGRKNSVAPAWRIAARTALALWLPALSMITMSPGFRAGARICRI
jgi:hypothetical protein